MLEQLDSSLFDWSTWRAGSLSEVFKIQCRERYIIGAKELLKEHAIGWARAECVPCRPKSGQVAVMFTLEDRVFWSHITQREFDQVFGD
jgi:hypothetical protein